MSRLLKLLVKGGFGSLLRARSDREAVELLAELYGATVEHLAETDEKHRRRIVSRMFGATLDALEPRRRPGVIAAVVGEAIGGLEEREAFLALTKLTDLVAVNPQMEDAESLAALQKTDGPIVVGPWLMEVGFELLYWIPFLRKRLGEAGVEPERVVALSRGGTDSWYRGVAGRYVDILDLVSPEELVRGNERLEREQDGKKPFRRSAYEAELVAAAAERLGIQDYATIFPAAIYKLFRNVWRSRFGGHPVRAHVEYAPIPGEHPRPAQLPFDGPYVAAKFYNSDCLPDSEENARFILRTIERLAKHNKVVLLNTGTQLDDHRDAMALVARNVFDASSWYGARDNLAVQTALVANASHLFCTYGGFSYLGPLLGVRTTSFFSATTFVGTHLDLSLRAFDPALGTSLALVPVNGLDASNEDLILGA